MTALPPLKTTSYHTDTPDSLALAKQGSLWRIGIDTADGIVELELSTAAACAVRQFFADAVCAECKPEEPKREPDPVPDLMAALKASMEAARQRREDLTR